MPDGPRKRRRLPSPALIISCIALFAALSGTSYALATGSITTREIQNGTIRNEDFKDGTLRGQEFKRDSLGGGAIKEQALDGTRIPEVASAARARTADSAAQATGLTLRVTLAGDGAKSNDRSVVSSAKLAVGSYQVIFDRDVRGCVPAATLVQAGAAPLTGEIAVAPLRDNANGIHVATAGSDGREADRAFHLLVSC
ncbi:MAG TPA: hypothetical protein VK506_00060 [Conexibacter sp.]|nr:hypothetical protein [Conexibacter sp.]